MLLVGDLILFKLRLESRETGQPVFSFIWRGGFYRIFVRGEDKKLVWFLR